MEKALETVPWKIEFKENSIIVMETKENVPIAVLPKTKESVLMSYAEMMYFFIKKLNDGIYDEFLSESQDGDDIKAYAEELFLDIQQDLKEVEK